MRKFTIMIALLLVVALATPAIGASFPDVPSNHWAYEAINELVAAGVIEGYPDGTYKGQNNLTRYEIAMIVSRVMDNMAAERAELMEKVESMDSGSGLTTEQAQDVTAIVKALMQKNMPEAPEAPTELTEAQANEVVNLIEALTFEYQAELKVLRSDYDELRADLGLLEENLASVRDRVTALEDATPPVSFSGSYSVKMTHKDVFKGDVIDTGSGFNHYYIEDAPLPYDGVYDFNSDGTLDYTIGDQDGEIDDEEFEAYVREVAYIIEQRVRDLKLNESFADIASYYNTVFDLSGDDAYIAGDISEVELAELAIREFNYSLTDQPVSFVDALTDPVYSDPSNYIDATETPIMNYATITAGPLNHDFAIKEDTADAVDSLTMWDDGDADAMDFEEGTELTHTLNLNADINYGGFVGQAGIELEKLDSTDEATFKSANLELENDELVMIYNETNEIDYSDFAVSATEFNAASFLYKPWGLSTFVGIDEVTVDDDVDPLSNEDKGDENLDVVWDDEGVAATEDGSADVYELYFDGNAVEETADYLVAGAQKTFVLEMADVKTTFAGRMNTDWEVKDTDPYEAFVLGAEATSKLSGFDLSGDVAVSTTGDIDEYGYMLNLDASTKLTDAFTGGFGYKNRGENFSPLYENDSVFDSDDAAYDKYGSGLASTMSGYGVSVAHDGSADGALVSGLDLDFGYDAVDYDGYTENDTKIGLSGKMAVMENLTVNGSYTQLDEPTGEETDYTEETKLYSVGAEFVPVENATVSASYSVMDAVEDEIETDNLNVYDAVNETTIDLSGSYDFTDYVSGKVGYTSIDGLDNYDGAKKSTTTVGVSLTDYPVMTGLTASASVDYESSSGEVFADDLLQANFNANEDFNQAALAATTGLEELETTKTSLSAGLAYELNDRTSLTYDLGYTTQEAKDEVSDLYSGNYMTNELGVVYTFTEDTDLTADYKHMKMDYDADDGADDWTAHQFEAGVSLSF